MHWGRPTGRTRPLKGSARALDGASIESFALAAGAAALEERSALVGPGDGAAFPPSDGFLRMVRDALRDEPR